MVASGSTIYWLSTHGPLMKATPRGNDGGTYTDAGAGVDASVGTDGEVVWPDLSQFSPAYPTDLAVDEENLYWAVPGPSDTNGIWRMALARGAPEHICSESAFAIALDDAIIYFLSLTMNTTGCLPPP